jgi:DNA-binding MltR family transcriptional regulator
MRDRECALMAAAYIDSLLEKLLEAYLIEDKALVPTLFGVYGPLGTFASRTDLAYGVGLIDAQTRKQITYIRKIRVEFAHTYEPITFEYPPIRTGAEN